MGLLKKRVAREEGQRATTRGAGPPSPAAPRDAGMNDVVL